MTLAPSLSVPGSLLRRYLALGLGYLPAYFALNALVDHHSLAGSAVTLWSPDNALSVMLVMESWVFAPLVWLAQIGVDVAFGHEHRLLAVVGAETPLAVGYMGLALTLRTGFGVRVTEMRPRDLVAVMALTPLFAALSGLVYCAALVAVGELTPDSFLRVFVGFWTGDAAAMAVLIPATGAVMRVFAARPWRRSVSLSHASFVAIVIAYLVIVIFLSAATPDDRYLFNLAFLPILLVGLKLGYDACALTLLFVQIALLAALEYHRIADSEFITYQVLMFILAVSGHALGATVDEWQATARDLGLQQMELAKVSERATNSMIAAATSHEISQPLASITAYVVSARRFLEATGGRERALAALRGAEGEAGRARVIIERLRDFVARGDVARDPIDLAQIVARAVLLQSDAARERGVALRFSSAGAAPARGDWVALEQAIANLILNALEARGVGEVRVAISQREGRAIVEVEDDGEGVSCEIADRLFEPFETTKARGMGLGLPLAREIAMRHGGELAFTPAIPRGSRFRLEIPLA